MAVASLIWIREKDTCLHESNTEMCKTQGHAFLAKIVSTVTIWKPFFFKKKLIVGDFFQYSNINYLVIEERT